MFKNRNIKKTRVSIGELTEKCDIFLVIPKNAERMEGHFRECSSRDKVFLQPLKFYYYYYDSVALFLIYLAFFMPLTMFV